MKRVRATEAALKLRKLRVASAFLESHARNGGTTLERQESDDSATGTRRGGGLVAHVRMSEIDEKPSPAREGHDVGVSCPVNHY